VFRVKRVWDLAPWPNARAAASARPTRAAPRACIPPSVGGVKVQC
jgi:hypothetical protein